MTNTKTLAAAVLLSIATSAPAAPLDAISGMVQQGDYQQALDRLDKLNDPGKRSRLLRGLALSGIGNFDEAERVFASIAADFPVAPEAYNNLAALHLAQQDVPQAKVMLKKALATDPRYEAVAENLTQLYIDQTVQSYQKAEDLPYQPTSLAFLDGSPVTSQDARVTALVELPANSSTNSPAAKSVAAAADSPQPTPSTSSARQTAEVPVQAVRQTLDLWALAWSSQRVDKYVSAYVADFTGAQASHAAWRALRTRRIAAPRWIKISISDLEIKPVGPGRAVVHLIQEYRSDTYKDRTRKELHMRLVDGLWKIEDEQTLDTTPL